MHKMTCYDWGSIVGIYYVCYTVYIGYFPTRRMYSMQLHMYVYVRCLLAFDIGYILNNPEERY